ncbi:hypothetical protein [Burkholderia alba]|uniref:hypothetical protein n=1 Tax=Burkholderia alba TaxID=2683677 RepID=UPI002B05291F|nr:hypothetical protein [Burkholderia alba]
MSQRKPTAPRRTGSVDRGQLSKRMLLPMPRHEIEALSLKYRTVFEALRMRCGSAYGLRALLQMVIVTSFIDEARRHEIRAEVLVAAQQGINAAFERGKQDREWWLDMDTEELVASLLTWHDDQLRTTPLAVLMEAIERLERFTSGKSYDRPPVRPIP